MSFTLDKVVPWGRSFEEYVAMFSLTPDDLKVDILGCGDGPSSFNSVLTQRSGKVISADPLFRYSKAQITQRITDTYAEVMEQTRQNQHEFVWDSISSVEQLGQIRMSAMQDFLDDYEQGLVDGRYRDASLPFLPFRDGQFGLALCSHFLFLYSDQLGLEFHLEAVREMCRVAREVRIFPLLKLGAEPSGLVDSVRKDIEAEGYRVWITRVGYEFQRGGNTMMKINRG
ncbi:MAG TPA: SAM-dependent methyltransferase [Nitrospiraceae bacterium]|jgi:hypothetical protein|nr:SAM-dependent methyltransferase [Nitrospiraceae bacterium]